MNAMTKIGILKDADLFRQRALIGDVWQHAHSKATVDVIDPASLEVLGTIPDMGRVRDQGGNRRGGRRRSRAGRRAPMRNARPFSSAGTTSCWRTQRIWPCC